MAATPTAGPIANPGNAHRQDQTSASTGTPRIVTRVRRNPTAVCRVRCNVDDFLHVHSQGQDVVTERLEDRHLGDAGGAPRCPEVEEYGPAREVTLASGHRSIRR